MSTQSFLINVFKRAFGQVESVTLSQRVRNDLKQRFEGHILNLYSADFAPDLVIRNNKSALVLQFKLTTDPSQPLPASANSSMLMLKDKAQDQIPNAEIVPVLVTNYQVDDVDRVELRNAGIRVIDINSKTYDPKHFSAQLEKLTEQSPNIAVS